MSNLCDCDRRDHIDSPDGICLNLSIAAEEADDRDRARWSRCGCCTADCPDVHPTETPGFLDGAVWTFAAE